MKAGFTLVEVMVAVAIAAVLILGISAATQSTLMTAERQKSDARREEQRSRAAELLRQDWRGRTKVLKPSTTPPAGTRVLLLTTTADSLSNGRATRLVTWTASESGLTRREGAVETCLLPGPLSLEFWDGVAWRSEVAGTPSAIRLMLQDPEEMVVLR